MRNPKRISKILTLLEELWNKTPDQRFGQMMINQGLIPDGKLWNIEDDKWEEYIKGRLK